MHAKSRTSTPSKRRGPWRYVGPRASALGLLAVGFAAAGCQAPVASDISEVVPGVTYRSDKAAGVDLLDIDLLVAKVRPVVVAEHVRTLHGTSIGDAYSVAEWTERLQAVGGLNGGYFGESYGQFGRRKQIVGLTLCDGSVVVPGGFASSMTRPGERFLRSVAVFGADGAPDIGWGTGKIGGPLRRYTSPVNPAKSETWPARSAIACGPRLFIDGRREITDHQERLMSPGRLSRSFIAFDRENGRPRHLLLGRCDSMEFTDLAAYLTDYFARTHGTAPREAMCLDGGPSAQLVYRRAGGSIIDTRPTGMFVPTAILLIPTR